MAKLLKYEFRKSRGALLALLVSTVLGEVMLLGGILFLPQDAFLLRGEPNLSNGTVFLLTVGTGILVLAGTFGVMLCSLLPMWTLRRELNSSQSCMLFLIPERSYAVLGAKVLEDVVVLAVSVLIFGLLSVADFLLLAWRGGGLVQFSEILLPQNLDMEKVGDVCSTLGMSALVWLTILMVCFFAIVMQASLLRGKRGSFWISLLIVLFLAIMILRAGSLLPEGNTAMKVLAHAGIVVLLYLLSGWIMEKHLSI
jgi:hypothetical protein